MISSGIGALFLLWLFYSTQIVCSIPQVSLANADMYVQYVNTAIKPTGG